MKNIKLGSFYLVGRKNNDFHNFSENTVVLAVGNEQSGIGKKGTNIIQILCLSTGERGVIPETELQSKFTTKSIEEMRQFFNKELKHIDKIEECMIDMNKEDVTTLEYMTWMLMEINEKTGATKTQKIQAIQNYVDAL